VLAVVWSRAVEALGLALFLVLAPLVLHVPPVLRGLQIAAGVALATVLVATRFQGWKGAVARLPRSLEEIATELAQMGWGGRLAGPTVLALLSWSAEWATYHLSLRAAHIPVSYAASFTALIAVNLGGILRVTPGNVGVVQAAMVGALLPFGVAAERAVAGGLALQAIEVLPILAITLALIGRSGLKRVLAAVAELPEAT